MSQDGLSMYCENDMNRIYRSPKCGQKKKGVLNATAVGSYSYHPMKKVNLCSLSTRVH